MEREVGVTVSIGLAPNRLLAKIAAGRDKPRGFAVIGAPRRRRCWRPSRCGCCPASAPRWRAGWQALGITRLGHLQALSDARRVRRLGEDGPALVRRARGEDARAVDPARETKSISAETTFDADLSRLAELEPHLWRMAEKLARRLRQSGLRPPAWC